MGKGIACSVFVMKRISGDRLIGNSQGSSLYIRPAGNCSRLSRARLQYSSEEPHGTVDVTNS
jgi:hypothetical protein